MILYAPDVVSNVLLKHLRQLLAQQILTANVKCVQSAHKILTSRLNVVDLTILHALIAPHVTRVHFKLKLVLRGPTASVQRVANVTKKSTPQHRAPAIKTSVAWPVQSDA